MRVVFLHAEMVCPLLHVTLVTANPGDLPTPLTRSLHTCGTVSVPGALATWHHHSWGLQFPP